MPSKSIIRSIVNRILPQKIIDKGLRPGKKDDKYIPFRAGGEARSMVITDDLSWLPDGINFFESDFAYRQNPLFYEEIKRDSQVAACIDVRKAQTSSLEWQVLPGDPKSAISKKQAEVIETILRRTERMHEVFDNALEALLPGRAIQEIIWWINPNTGLAEIKKFLPTEWLQWTVDFWGSWRYRTKNNLWQGEPVDPRRIYTHIHNPEGGSRFDSTQIGRKWQGAGLGSKLYWLVSWKRHINRFLLRYAEIHSKPVRIGWYPMGDANVRAEMADLLQHLNNKAYGLMGRDVSSGPGKGPLTEVEDLPITGTGADIYNKILERYDKQISKVCLGGADILEHGRIGARSADTAQQAQTIDQLVLRDRQALEATLSDQPVRFLADFNRDRIGDPRIIGYPHFTFKTSASIKNNPTMFMQIVKMAVDMGVEVPVEQIREVSGLDVPSPEEPILEKPAANDPFGGMGGGIEGAPEPGSGKDVGKGFAEELGLLNFTQDFSILDPAQNTLDPEVWDLLESGMYRMKQTAIEQIMARLRMVLDKTPQKLLIVGSIASFNWTPLSDIDVTLEHPKGKEIGKQFVGINGEFLLNTKHPVNFFVTDRFNPANADAIYDITSATWIKGPVDVFVDAADFLGRFRESATKSDATRAELTRDLIDFDILTRMNGSKRKELDGLVKAKIAEIADDVTVLVREFESIKGFRKLAFATPPAKPSEVSKFVSKNVMPANVIFKLFERFHFVGLVKELKKIQPVETRGDVAKVRKAVKSKGELR